MLLLIFLLAVLNVGYSSNSIINRDVQRTIDASTAILKIYTEIKAINIVNHYKLAFPSYAMKNLSFLSVQNKGKDLSIGKPITDGNVTIFTVNVGESSPTLKVQAVFTDMMEPFPAEITQSESQLVRIKFNHFFLSPYETENMKTVVKLASSGIESFTKLAPHSVRGSSITFGPYKDVKPLSYSGGTIHFVNNKPFAKFSTLTREVEVSHWGNIAFEEVYELKHAGARMKGGFSRFDYQAKRSTQSPSFRGLTAVLPIEAYNVYYRDQIGNISTSSIKLMQGFQEMEIQTRFPMFGGWQVQFYIGYSVPTESALFISPHDGRYNLKFDYFTLFDDVWVEDMETKVILPEGATNIKVDAPYPMRESWSKRYTYLDSEFNGGRPVVSLRSSNIVAEHDGEIIISYNFSPSRMIVEPLMLTVSFFIFFILCAVIARLDTTVRGVKYDSDDLGQSNESEAKKMK